MNNDIDRTITPNQMTVIISGFMLGMGVLSLPNDLIKYAKQDAWISAFIGVLYPIYIVLLANYMAKKFPKQNILILSKKYFGKVLGNIFNFIFGLFFMYITISICTGMTYLLDVYIVDFLLPIKIILIILFSALIMAAKRIDDIGRINQVIFYGTLILFFVPVSAIKQGSSLNIKPVFDSGIINILKASKESAFVYSGVEVIFLLYPQITDIKQLKKSAFKGIFITAVVCTWFTFICIYYLGIDIMPKFLWPVIHVTETITIPVVNNFKYIYSFLWSLILFKVLGNYYFATAFVFSDFFKSIERKKICYAIYPIFVFLSLQLTNEVVRKKVIYKLTNFFVIFNLVTITILCLIIAFKKDENK